MDQRIEFKTNKAGTSLISASIIRTKPNGDELVIRFYDAPSHGDEHSSCPGSVVASITERQKKEAEPPQKKSYKFFRKPTTQDKPEFEENCLYSVYLIKDRIGNVCWAYLDDYLRFYVIRKNKERNQNRVPGQEKIEERVLEQVKIKEFKPVLSNALKTLIAGGLEEKLRETAAMRKAERDSKQANRRNTIDYPMSVISSYMIER